jgi:hypothetical protein
MYEVGQVIYTILEDKYKVVPLKISEQVITKTLEEEVISYKVLMPGKANKKISLDKIPNVWTNLSDIRKHLIDNANNAINKMLSETSSIQSKYFFKKKDPEIDIDTCINDPNIDKIYSDDHESIKVDLGNGQIGNLKIDRVELDQKKNEENIVT